MCPDKPRSKRSKESDDIGYTPLMVRGGGDWATWRSNCWCEILCLNPAS